MHFLILLALLAPLQIHARFIRPQRRQQICNGHASFCDRKYNEVTWIGAHNSPFDGDDVSDNQTKNVTQQLDAGIRFLQGQVHPSSTESGDEVDLLSDDDIWRKRSVRKPRAASEGELHLCHTWCGIRDAGTLSTYLATIKTWLDGHPNEVVTLLLTNQEGRPISEFDTAFEQTKLKAMAFSPPTEEQKDADLHRSWPTYGELINTGQRLVVFLDRIQNGSVPYILDEWKYFFETPFSITDPAKFEDCAVDRPTSAKEGDGRMYIVNHSLHNNTNDLFAAVVPNRETAPQVNAATGDMSIGAHAEVCQKAHGHKPNVVLVDWFDVGDVFEAQNALNGV